MSEEFECPRAVEGPFVYGKKAKWRNNHTCSYCGSLSEEKFFAAVEAGVEVGPTDKSYKAYLTSRDKSFQQTYRDCPKDATCTGPEDCTHWVTRDVDHTKFYFQHLSKEGQQRFVDLVSAKKMKIGYPGHFYVRPYFCERVSVQ